VITLEKNSELNTTENVHAWVSQCD